jgi:hypothetical protein
MARFTQSSVDRETRFPGAGSTTGRAGVAGVVTVLVAKPRSVTSAPRWSEQGTARHSRAAVRADEVVMMFGQVVGQLASSLTEQPPTYEVRTLLTLSWHSS